MAERIITVGSAHGLVFLPDPKLEWDGGSLP